MIIESWAIVISAVGTMIAAGVAAYSARLTWHQVRFEFEPNLTVLSAHFQIKSTSKSLVNLFWEIPSDAARYENGGDTEYEFKLMNIGNGAAFGIKISTEFDYPNVFRNAVDKATAHAPDLNFRYDDFGCHVLWGDKVCGGFRLPDESYSHVDTIEGGVGRNRITTFSIEPSLSFFVLCYSYHLMNTHEQDHTEKIPLTFRIEYTNSANRRKISRQNGVLTIHAGRWRKDFSDGVVTVSLSTQGNQ